MQARLGPKKVAFILKITTFCIIVNLHNAIFGFPDILPTLVSIVVPKVETDYT